MAGKEVEITINEPTVETIKACVIIKALPIIKSMGAETVVEEKELIDILMETIRGL